jgi:transposase
MLKDVITIHLGLPEFQVLDHGEEEHGLLIWLERISNEEVCPRCGELVRNWSEQRWRTVQDLPILNKPVWLMILQRRFRCLACQYRFWEKFPGIGLRQRQTKRFQDHLLNTLRGTSVSKASRDNGVGYRILERLCLQAVERTHPGNKPLPRKLGVDEFAPCKGRRYHTIIVSAGTGEIFEVSEGHNRDSLEQILKSRPGAKRVREIVMDMWQPFYKAARAVCKRAHIVIDRFHVVNHILKAVDEVRRRLQRQVSKEAKGFLKECADILLKAPEELSEDEKIKRDKVLSLYPELARAVELAEAFKRWYEQSPDRDKARHRLHYWYLKVRAAGIPELDKVMAMIRR